MKSANSWTQRKQWLKPSRFVPLLTILAGGATIVLSLLRAIQLTLAEQIVIALLALLAVDALTERLSVLESLQTKLSNLSAAQALKGRAIIRKPIEYAEGANEIRILVIDGASVIIPYAGFYERKLKEGCNIWILLLNPESSSVGMWDKLVNRTDSRAFVEQSLNEVERLTQLKTKGTCEVRLLDMFLPFSLFIVDGAKESGSMTVEYHAYHVSIDERPHVDLSALNDPYWFDYYRRQFEEAWSTSTDWTPRNAQLAQS